uniref:Uncharacterized protein n=1 Tax=Arundo donax TaxID=35708 RepID=A0A0A9U081_ARUDO
MLEDYYALFFQEFCNGVSDTEYVNHVVLIII